MKHKGLQRAFALMLTLLFAFGSLGGFGLERSALAAPPVITAHPTSQTVYVGETTTFTVAATGDSLTYQWQVSKDDGASFNNTTSDGSDSETIQIGVLTTTVAKSGYQFRCVVTSGTDSAISHAATLTVKPNLDRIAVTTPPTKTSYTAGESFEAADMVVTAYYKDELNQETSAEATGYTVTPSGALATTDISVEISYTENNVTKTTTQGITVAAAPVTPTISFTTQPQNKTVVAGSITASDTLTAAASVSPSGTAELNWFACDSAGVIPSGGSSLGTGGTFAIPTTLAAGTYHYLCQASFTGAQNVNSDVATVTVTAAPTTPTITFTTEPQDKTVVAGSITASDTLTAAASVTPSGTVTLNWYECNSTGGIIGTSLGTTGTLAIPTTLTAGTHYFLCRAVSAGAQNVNSRIATVTVTAAPTTPTISFTTQPAASTTVTVGGITGNLTAAATVSTGGTATLNWFACDSAGTTSGSSLGTGGTFAIPTGLTAGTYYYLCQATFTGATSVKSSVATVKAVDPTYNVTSGAGGTYLKGGNGTLKFTIDAVSSQLQSVVVDNTTQTTTLTQGTDYDVASGSTIVTLRNSYLRNLLAGRYTLTVNFAGGHRATTTFNISSSPYVWDLYADITQGNHVETTWLGKGERMRLTLYVANHTSDYVKWHYSSRRIALSNTSTRLTYDSASGYYVTHIDVTPKYNGNVWVYAENSGLTTSKHHFTVVGLNNLPATGQDGRPIRILIGVSILTAAALGAMYVWKRKKAR